MYFTFNEFVFIIMAVIVGMLIYKIGAAIIKKIAATIDKIKARRLRRMLKIIELEKASEKAEKKVDELM